jgi:hypothetical protein
MKTLIKRLPVFAFILAALAAFAFAPPQTSEYGFDGTNWIDVSNMTPGQDYLCNVEEDVCTRSAPNPSAPQVKSGLFELIEK